MSGTEAIATIVSQVVLVCGSVLPYIPQYSDIAKSGDASGFSTLVCFVLVIANSLRIVYWFGHYFNEALLLQSVLMLITMFGMIELCVRVEKLRRRSLQIPETEKRFSDFNLGDFWQWTDLSSYIQFTLLVTAIAFSTLYLFLDNAFVVEGIGYTALLIESCLGIPQFVKNQRSRSTHGMNVLMVVMWTIGDCFKEFFYIWKLQPLPFVICAAIQLFVDFLILAQVVFFNK